MLSCITCGESYKYCSSCVINPEQSAWMIHYCGENCRDIGGVIHAHYHGKISTDDAVEQLRKLGVYDSAKLADNVRDYITEHLTPVVHDEPEETEDELYDEEAEG